MNDASPNKFLLPFEYIRGYNDYLFELTQRKKFNQAREWKANQEIQNVLFSYFSLHFIFLSFPLSPLLRKVTPDFLLLSG